DAVIGRYVLQFQPEPTVMLRGLARHLRPAGLVCFHELDWSGRRAYPPVPLYEECSRWIAAAVEAGGADAHVGIKLDAMFRDAGLPPPILRSEVVVGGELYRDDLIALVVDPV